MPTFSVIGLGNWGTALAEHTAAKGYTVTGWSADSRIVDGINKNHRNPVYLTDTLLSELISATGDIRIACRCDVLIMAVPSSALDEIVPRMEVSPGTMIVSGIKGIEHNLLCTPLQFFERSFGAAVPLAVMSGPSFAADLVRKRPVGIVAASKSEETARRTAELFASDWMRVYISTDPLGVELGGVLKNVVAVAAGVCDGLELGDSARAMVVTRGLAEMTRIAEAMGAERSTLMGLSGLGDLTMTASSPTSRNRTVGYRLGKGESLNLIIKTLGSVAEGVTTAPLMLELGKKFGVELPLAEAVVALLSGAASPQETLRNLLQRPLRREY